MRSICIVKSLFILTLCTTLCLTTDSSAWWTSLTYNGVLRVPLVCASSWQGKQQCMLCYSLCQMMEPPTEVWTHECILIVVCKTCVSNSNIPPFNQTTTASSTAWELAWWAAHTWSYVVGNDVRRLNGGFGFSKEITGQIWHKLISERFNYRFLTGHFYTNSSSIISSSIIAFPFIKLWHSQWSYLFIF